MHLLDCNTHHYNIKFNSNILRIHSMKILIIVSICFMSLASFGQENLIKWNDNEPLQWKDFTGKINDTSWFDAECFAEIRYNYSFNTPQDFKFQVFANFDKAISWSRKEYQTEGLLKHEQLHFDIAQLYSLKIKELFESYNYTRDFLAEIQLLFAEKRLEYLSTQHQYDEETEHSLNKKKQKEWADNVSGELRRMQFKQQGVVSATTKKSDH